MKIEIQPSKEIIEKWIRDYVPEKDIFFLPEKNLKSIDGYLQNALVIPREEFFQHKSYNQIQLANSYESWNISLEAEYVIVAPPDWVNSLPSKTKAQLFHIQKEMGRGLIYPVLDLSIEASFFKDYIIEVDEAYFLILQRAMWDELSFTLKENLIKAFAQEWEDWTCYAFPEKAPLYLKKFANSFPSAAGSNCLSTVLFSITEQEWMIYEWIHPQTFIQKLIQANYSLTSSQECKAGDVVTWEDKEGVIQHASYHIGSNLFFNKNGQTFFNPWKIVDFNEFKDQWNKYRLRVYRKM
ncbi:hypothetical protein VBD025_16175 [Virgibacillus flavescens]|uniref:hypothetical protein n=1 Tax=Virgibacillus flavescens TaxID=1611422 RepID=UPI003D32591F